MKKIVPEKINFYNKDYINEAVGHEDLESDIYQGAKKLGKLGTAATIGASAAALSKGTGMAKQWLIIPSKMKSLRNNIEKDIQKWSDDYQLEFIKNTEMAIERVIAAKPNNVSSPQDIQNYNSTIKSIMKAYKNMYIEFLQGFHGMLKRDFAISTQRLLKLFKTSGFGSISDGAVRKLTARWDQYLRELNKLAFEHVNEELNNAEELIKSKLGQQSPLLNILHERPTVFFTTSDYEKISSFLEESINNIKNKETANTNNTTNENYIDEAKKFILFYDSKYNNYLDDFNNGNYEVKLFGSKLKKLQDKFDNINTSKIPSEIIPEFQSLESKIEDLLNKFYKKHPNTFTNKNYIDIIQSYVDEYNNLEEKSSVGSASSEDVLDDINDLLKSIKKINPSMLNNLEIKEYTELLNKTKKLKMEVSEQVYSMLVYTKLLDIFKELTQKGYKNNNINIKLLRQAGSNFAVEFIKDKTSLKDLFEKIKHKTLSEEGFEKFIKKYK
ncbi:MAG: hypothetical protein RSE41_07790 [Clostridia bacterium]